MNNNEILKTLTSHEKDIENLSRRVNVLTELTKSVNSLAVAVEKIATKQEGQDKKIATLEENANFKIRTVWSCVASALIGAIISLVLTKIGG